MKLPEARNRWTERLLIDDAFDAYLEREEHAARVYGQLASRLEAGARERAEKQRLSDLRPLLS